jgi:hypothetical protein
MHLPHDHSCALARHVARSHTVFDPVGCIGTLVHHADATSRQRDDESPVAKSIELTSEGKSSVRNQSQSVDWLLESNCVIEMLSQALGSVVVDIYGH